VSPVTRSPVLPPYEEFKAWLDALPAGRLFAHNLDWVTACPVAEFLTERNGGEKVYVGTHTARFDHLCEGRVALGARYVYAVLQADCVMGEYGSKGVPVSVIRAAIAVPV